MEGGLEEGKKDWANKKKRITHDSNVMMGDGSGVEVEEGIEGINGDGKSKIE